MFVTTLHENEVTSTVYHINLANGGFFYSRNHEAGAIQTNISRHDGVDRALLAYNQYRFLLPPFVKFVDHFLRGRFKVFTSFFYNFAQEQAEVRFKATVDGAVYIICEPGFPVDDFEDLC